MSVFFALWCAICIGLGVLLLSHSVLAALLFCFAIYFALGCICLGCGKKGPESK